MNKEEITKEDILNVTGSMFDTMFDYIDNSNKELEQLQQENKQLKEELNQKNKVIEELKKWLDEYYKSNEKWYNTELSSHDKEYFRAIYLDTDFLTRKFKDKIEELEKGSENNG